MSKKIFFMIILGVLMSVLTIPFFSCEEECDDIIAVAYGTWLECYDTSCESFGYYNDSPDYSYGMEVNVNNEVWTGYLLGEFTGTFDPYYFDETDYGGFLLKACEGEWESTMDTGTYNLWYNSSGVPVMRWTGRDGVYYMYKISGGYYVSGKQINE
jgi:hypothetical protein